MEIAAILAKLETLLTVSPQYTAAVLQVVQWLESHVGASNTTTTPPTS
jgi:hypothetical protein